MAESTKEDSRARKHSKMRKSLSSAFGDPLEEFNTPTAVRNLSTRIDSNSAELEGRIRKISHSSEEPIGDAPDKTSIYISQRQDLVEDIETHFKEARQLVREARTEMPSEHEKNELMRALKELDGIDAILLKERTALAADQIRLKYAVLGQPSHVKIGEAYLMALTKNLPEPADSSYKDQHKRSTEDQTSFRRRLIKAYNTDGTKILDTPPAFEAKIWCPVSGKAFDKSIMKAAHIVPYAIGESNATYLFGSNVEDAYDVIWSTKNGLMLHSVLEGILDDGRMVIVPDPTDPSELICVILSQELLKDNRSCPAIDAPYSTIHKRRLKFQTDSKPGKRNLYLHALLSLFRRRRYDVPGWKKDREQVFTGQIWATPGKWARKSMIQALALEVGDNWENVEAVGGLGEFPDAKSPEEEKRLATLVRYTLESRAIDVEDEEDDGRLA